MAVFVVSSRFAGLKVEDDDSPPNSLQLKPKKVVKNTAKKSEPLKKPKSQPAKSQLKTAPKNKKKKKPNTTSAKQWEQWKQKDEELVDDNFEDDLHQAILLSKLDFEENKDVYKKTKKDLAKEKVLEDEAAKLKNKKIKKKNVMSLDQFNDMMNGDEAKCINDADDNLDDEETPVRDTQFFERVKSETKNELVKAKNNDTVRNRLSKSDEVITRVQFMDALERKDKEIAGLRQEVIKLKQELYTVKSRNKKLCNILGQGEMKDKAEVLCEVEKLRSVQSELTAELALLHTDLEKARSMNSEPKAKDKKNGAKKKNIRFDVSSEALLAKDSSSGTAG